MASISRPFVWFYREFGIESVQKTGRNATLIIFARCLRMVGNGACSLIFPLFFSNLKYTDSQIGLFMTLTLLGDVCLGTYVTLIADRVGRRRVLLFGSVFMISSGIILSMVENYWILLLCAIFSVISVTGGDFGPFRSVEESILSQLTTPKARPDVLSWYVTLSTLGSAVGAELAGRAVDYLSKRDGWTVGGAYHAVFSLYLFTGVINALFVLFLSDECEAKSGMSEAYSQVPQEASEELEMEQPRSEPQPQLSSMAGPKPSILKRVVRAAGSKIGSISASTRRVMYKLWLLLILDSLADGMVPYSLTTYYIDTKFHPSKSTLGDVTSIGFFLGAASSIFAGPLARRIGLINTMVFTHIPSSAAVLVFPFPNILWMAIILFFVRTGLNNMDQAPRAAFIAGVVKPSERTAVMGITSMLRTMASTFGPTLTGFLAGSQRFWLAFVAAGAFRLTYDVGLYVLFINEKLHQHEQGGDQEGVERSRARRTHDDYDEA